MKVKEIDYAETLRQLRKARGHWGAYVQRPTNETLRQWRKAEKAGEKWATICLDAARTRGMVSASFVYELRQK